jgi:hypothetical protein
MKDKHLLKGLLLFKGMEPHKAKHVAEMAGGSVIDWVKKHKNVIMSVFERVAPIVLRDVAPMLLNNKKENIKGSSFVDWVKKHKKEILGLTERHY